MVTEQDIHIVDGDADDDSDELQSTGAIQAEVFELTIDATSNGERLDASVVRAASVSRAQAQRLFEAGAVMVNGAVPNKLATRMRVGDHVRVEIATAKPLEVVAEAIPLDIYFEDAHLIVINKPADARAAGINLIYQELSVATNLTVAENVAFGLRFAPRGERGWRVMDALARVGLTELDPRTRPGALSKSGAPGTCTTQKS